MDRPGSDSTTLTYDANGNMTCTEENGQIFNLTYNDEYRLAIVEMIAGTCASANPR